MLDVRELATLVDIDRYPIHDLASPTTKAVIAEARASLAERGVAALTGFLRPESSDQVAADAMAAQTNAHLQNSAGTAYLEPPDEAQPDGHPRRIVQRSRTWVIAYDLVAESNPIRRLFEWDGMTDFLAAVLQCSPLFRMDDPLGALNLTIMEHDHVQGWHYDSTDFVVSLAIQSSEAGGEFECARNIRDATHEHYEDVARVMNGDADDLVRVYPMLPGTLMVFMGRHSLHRVAPVVGATPRIVGLLGYDTMPGTNSSDGLKRARYGRTESIGAQ